MPGATSGFWIEKIKRLGARDMTPRQIEIEFDLLKDPPPGAGAPPRERTIRKYMPSAAERAEEYFVFFPEVIADGTLPCDSSSAVVELLRHYFDRVHARPTVRIARWYALLRKADGGNAPVERLAKFAALFGDLEASGRPLPGDALRTIEALVIYQAWEPPDTEDYWKALVDGIVPGRDLIDLYEMLGGGTELVLEQEDAAWRRAQSDGALGGS